MEKCSMGKSKKLNWHKKFHRHHQIQLNSGSQITKLNHIKCFGHHHFQNNCICVILSDVNTIYLLSNYNLILIFFLLLFYIPLWFFLFFFDFGAKCQVKWNKLNFQVFDVKRTLLEKGILPYIYKSFYLFLDFYEFILKSFLVSNAHSWKRGSYNKSGILGFFINIILK